MDYALVDKNHQHGTHAHACKSANAWLEIKPNTDTQEANFRCKKWVIKWLLTLSHSFVVHIWNSFAQCVVYLSSASRISASWEVDMRATRCQQASTNCPRANIDTTLRHHRPQLLTRLLHDCFALSHQKRVIATCCYTFSPTSAFSHCCQLFSTRNFLANSAHWWGTYIQFPTMCLILTLTQIASGSFLALETSFSCTTAAALSATNVVQSRSFWTPTASKGYHGWVTAQAKIPSKVSWAFWSRKCSRKPPWTSGNWLRNLFVRGGAKTVYAMLATNWSIQFQLVQQHWTMPKAHLPNTKRTLCFILMCYCAISIIIRVLYKEIPT